MRINQLDGLTAFVAVAQTRSFTFAATTLQVSTQAISQSIKSLEERIGVRLFHRTTRSVRLTQDGEWFLEQVGPALTTLADATESLRERRKEPTGVLRISVPRPAFFGVLQSGLARFHALYPEIQLDLRFDDGFADIVDEGLDAGIRLGHSVPPGMIGVPLSDHERFSVVGEPGYLDRTGRPANLAELYGHDCIRFRSPASGQVYKWKLMDGDEPVEIDVSGSLIVNDASAQVTCALLGLGLAYVLHSNVKEYLATGQLEELVAICCPTRAGLFLYYAGRRQLPTKLRCFIDFWKDAHR